MAAAATTGTGGPASSRFAAACGVLSQYVRAADHGIHHAPPASAVRPLALMPGADVVPDGREEHEQEQKAGPASGARQLAIFYGGRVLVLDECPADKAAALLRLAAGAAAGRGEEAGGVGGELAAATDLPVARKASLQRFMEKRKGRLAAR